MVAVAISGWYSVMEPPFVFTASSGENLVVHDQLPLQPPRLSMVAWDRTVLHRPIPKKSILGVRLFESPKTTLSVPKKKKGKRVINTLDFLAKSTVNIVGAEGIIGTPYVHYSSKECNLRISLIHGHQYFTENCSRGVYSKGKLSSSSDLGGAKRCFSSSITNWRPRGDSLWLLGYILIGGLPTTSQWEIMVGGLPLSHEKNPQWELLYHTPGRWVQNFSCWA